tara:strand:+ start:1177 stop:3267 length:2091 start_codon:yes stop_codon:yes gene_type:complete
MGNKWMPKYNECRLLYLTAKEDPKTYGGEWANLVSEMEDLVTEDENFKSIIELRIPLTRLKQAKDVTTSHAKLVLDVLQEIANTRTILKEDQTKLNTFVIPNKPMYRIFEIDDLKELKGFTGEWIVQEKFDGLRIQIHKLKTVKIYSFNGNDITDKFPKQVKRLEQDAFPKCILDAEAVLYKDDEPLHRAETLAYINRKEGKADIKVHVFDILRHQGEDIYFKKLEERIMTLFKEYSALSDDQIQFPSKRDTRSADSYEDIEDYAKEIMDNPTAEGVVIKDAKSSYIVGKKKNPKWVKWKKFVDLDLIVLETRENKNGTYSYTLGAGPMDDDDQYTPVVEREGKRYLKVGKALNTTEEVKVGNIIRVKVDEVQSNKNGFSIYSAKFVEIPEVTEAERIITLKFLSEGNKKMLSEYTVEALKKSYVLTDSIHGEAIIKGSTSMEGFMFYGFENNNLMAKNAMIDLDLWKEELGNVYHKDSAMLMTLVSNMTQDKSSVTVKDIINRAKNMNNVLSRLFKSKGEELEKDVTNFMRERGNAYGILYDKASRKFYNDDKIELKEEATTFELWRRKDKNLNFIIKHKGKELVWRIEQDEDIDLYNLFGKADKFLAQIDDSADKVKIISKGGAVIGSQRDGYHEYIIDSKMYDGKIHFRVVPIADSNKWIVWTGYKTKPTSKTSDEGLVNIYDDKYKKLKFSD